MKKVFVGQNSIRQNALNPSSLAVRESSQAWGDRPGVTTSQRREGTQNCLSSQEGGGVYRDGGPDARTEIPTLSNV